MPCIKTSTNVKITEETLARLNAQFGQAISILPGKSEQWLMLRFEDERTMFFKGKNDQPIAYVEVDLYGSANAQACAKLTKELTDILERELTINPDHIYIRYAATPLWGWNGDNF